MSDPPTRSPRAGQAGEDGSLFQSIRKWLRDLGGARAEEVSLSDIFERMLEENRDLSRPLSADERLMLTNILEFGELTVDDCMVPRADIVAVEEDATREELIATMVAAAHTRLPVYRETLDDVVGMVHIKDLLACIADDRAWSLPTIMRQVLFVPPSMKALDLLAQMRITRIHMAIVVDEFGGTDGLVTVEDVVEEIVGEIRDEHENEEAPGLSTDENGVIDADARVPIEDLEARIDVSLLAADREDDIHTLGGLVFDLAGRVPAAGEIIRHPAGVELEVVEADARRVKRLRIRKVTDAGAVG